MSAASVLHLMLALSVLLWLNSGTYSYIAESVPDLVKLSIFGLWLCMACTSRGYLETLVLKSWPLVFFYVVVIGASFFEDSAVLFLLVKNVPYILILFSIFLYYFDARRLRHQRVIVIVLLLDCAYVGINTSIGLQANPQVSRYLSAQTEVQQALLGSGAFHAIGNYAYFYGLVMLAAVFLFRGLDVRGHRTLGIVAFAAFAASVLLILQAQFTIAILLLSLLVLGLLILRISRRESRHIWVVLTLGVLMIASSYLPNILMAIASSDVVPREVAVRFGELSSAFSVGMVVGGDLPSRLALYGDSITAFLSDIAFGTLGGSGAGLHSSILDLLATFGLFALFMFGFFVQTFRYVRGRFTGDDRTFVDMIWLYYVCLALLNTAIFSPIYVALLVIVPMSLSIISADRGKVGRGHEGTAGG